MKLFAYILSVYVVILTIMPCIDMNEDTTNQKVELSTNRSDTQHSQSDHCSPFCTCTCCASPVVFQNTTIQFEYYSIVQEYISEYHSSYISSTHNSIWQPPKIS